MTSRSEIAVRVLLFAGLAERAGVRERRMAELPAALTIGALLARLERDFPFLREVPFTVARNRAVARRDEALEDGDEVALLPPVSGG